MEEVKVTLETGRINAGDIYKELWEGRNFELSHLWQRSVFLAAFMIAIAGGYGAIAMNILFPSESKLQGVKYLQHLAGFGMCMLGLTFSILWVMMSKGSKLWYERYENALNYFTDCRKMESIFYASKNFDIDSIKSCESCEQRHSQDKGIEPRPFPQNGILPYLNLEEPNDDIFSLTGGSFSMSKVNIMIGIVGIVSWFILSVIHFCKFETSLDGISKNSSLLAMILFGVFVSSVITLLIYSCLYKLCHHDMRKD